jgi:hypothetical protein
MYSQLPFITGGRSLIHNLRTRHAVVTGTHFARIWPTHIANFCKNNCFYNKHNCVWLDCLRLITNENARGYDLQRRVGFGMWKIQTKCRTNKQVLLSYLVIHAPPTRLKWLKATALFVRSGQIVLVEWKAK